MITRPCVRYDTTAAGLSAGTQRCVLASGQPGHRPCVGPDTLSCVSAFRAAVLALGAAALTAACAAGQHAATAFEKPSVDAAQGQIGSIQLQGVALQAPTSPAYSSGADVALKLYIVNDGHSGDALTNVTSPAFGGGWDVVASSTLSGSAPSASDSVSPAPLTPSAPSSPSVGAPQQIGAGDAVGLGLTDLRPDGSASTNTLVLKGLANTSAPLYPGTTVSITFTFARAGQTTLSVPVQITAKPNTATLPGAATPAA